MTTSQYRSEVTEEGTGIVRVTRKFAAPRPMVWKAMTEPELVKRWLVGPPGWSMPICEMDVRVGGTYRWWWVSDEDDQEFGFRGEYHEVEAPERLVNTEYFEQGNTDESMGDGSHVTLTLTEQDGVTTAVTVMDFHTAQARADALATGMTEGMEMSYQLLDTLLEEQKKG